MGRIATGFTFSHQVFGEGFYMMDILVKRLSDSEDRIPVMVSERLIDITQDYVGEYIEIHGQFRSYNRHEEKRNRLVLSVFAREVKFVEEGEESIPVNQIFLDGYICKPPVYRKTPLGREIADLLMAVNRPYGKSDYIPCICWGRNARYASAFEVGGHVLIWGRIQSREYMKRISENETEKRIAYEVSVSKLEYILLFFQNIHHELLQHRIQAKRLLFGHIPVHPASSDLSSRQNIWQQPLQSWRETAMYMKRRL